MSKESSYEVDEFGRDIRRSRSRSKSIERNRSSSPPGNRSLESTERERFGRKRVVTFNKNRYNPRQRIYTQQQSTLAGSSSKAVSVVLEDYSPMLTFREFVLSKCNEETPSEVAVADYASYTDKWHTQTNKQYFDQCSKCEFMREQYLPSYKSKRLQYLRDLSMKTLNRLMKGMNDGSLCVKMSEKISGDPSSDGLNDQMNVENPAANTDTQTQSSELEEGEEVGPSLSRHIQLMDDFSSHCIYFKSIPPLFTRSMVINEFQAYRGIQGIYFGDCCSSPPNDLSRPCWVVCESVSECESVMASVGGKHLNMKLINGVNVECVMKCSKNISDRPLVIDADANSDRRMAVDERQLLELWRALCKYWELENPLEDYMTTHSITHLIDRIDVLTYFIRRVFGFEYWLSKDCGDYGVLYHTVGTDMVRLDQSSSCHSSDSEWCRLLDENTQEYIHSLSLHSYTEDINQVNELSEQEQFIRTREKDKFVNLNFNAKDNGFVCELCGKRFQGEDFVKKHVALKHGDVIDDKGTEICMRELITDVFLNDPNHFIPSFVDNKQRYSRPNIREPGHQSMQSPFTNQPVSGVGQPINDYRAHPRGNREFKPRQYTRVSYRDRDSPESAAPVIPKRITPSAYD